jgi:hypothetical protein
MIIFLITTLAFGQEGDRKINYQKETEIDFDGLEITGEMVKPQGALIIERSGVRFNPLISLRTDWNQEMAASVKEIK